MKTREEQQENEDLLSNMKAMLPDEYQDAETAVSPVSMGSAGLSYDSEGKVAWDRMWLTFCHLAMAGGPPHRGTLLQAGTPDAIAAQPEAYRAVVAEICRGLPLATALRATPSVRPGWVRVECGTAGMAGWMQRAIVMENVSCRCEGCFLELPAGPDYRLAKEIKNVMAAVAKTSHYWIGHMSPQRQRIVAHRIVALGIQEPLHEPAVSKAEDADDLHRNGLGEAIYQRTGLCASPLQYPGWLGVQVDDLSTAIWMMRALVASNVLSRREGLSVFIPLNTMQDPGATRAAQIFTRVWSAARNAQASAPSPHLI